MSGLRCWPGATAYISGGETPGCEVHRGRFVVCVRLSTHYVDHWVTEPALYNPASGKQIVWGDKHLTPITPPPGTDCTTHDADKPQPVEA